VATAYTDEYLPPLIKSHYSSTHKPYLSTHDTAPCTPDPRLPTPDFRLQSLQGLQQKQSVRHRRYLHRSTECRQHIEHIRFRVQSSPIARGDDDSSGQNLGHINMYPQKIMSILMYVVVPPGAEDIVSKGLLWRTMYRDLDRSQTLEPWSLVCHKHHLGMI